MTSLDEIARGMEHGYARIEADEGLRAEFAASRADFFARPDAAVVPGAELRHLEWFLLERPSPTLGAVPLLAFTGTVGGGDPAISPALKASLLASIPGAFEVTTAAEGPGYWVRDLFTQGELPLAGPGAALPLAAGDVLVGRLFPLGDGTFAPSPAVAVYRSPELLSAVRADLAAMRQARRGVLRIQQLELEHLFHGLTPAVRAPRTSTGHAQETRTALRALGLDEPQVSAVLARLRRAASGGEGMAVTEILNQLAFETPVDLEKARQVLLEAWQVERAADEPRSGLRDAGAALAAFDRGRAEGKDLELLFRELERDLGLEDEGSPDEAEESPDVPDFPGVVGAMVEEFLWDVEREAGPEQARRFAPLRLLGEYAQDIGVFEDLGRLRLLDFSCRWLLDETSLSGPETAGVLDALAEFCTWAEERHDLPLQREFEAPLRELRQSVPRLAATRAFAKRDERGELLTVTRLEGGRVELAGGSTDPVSLRTPALQEHLRVGDWVRLTRDRAAFAGAYPAQLREVRGDEP